MNLANNLKLLRMRNGELSQQQLAELVGCSRQTIISIETGKINPSVEIALKLSHVLNVPVDQIFALEEGKEKECFCDRISELFRFYKKKRSSD